jgi:hypothetical protein
MVSWSRLAIKRANRSSGDSVCAVAVAATATTSPTTRKHLPKLLLMIRVAGRFSSNWQLIMRGHTSLCIVAVMIPVAPRIEVRDSAFAKPDFERLTSVNANC